MVINVQCLSLFLSVFFISLPSLFPSSFTPPSYPLFTPPVPPSHTSSLLPPPSSPRHSPLPLYAQADREESLKRAALLIEMHLKDLRTQKQLIVRAEMKVRYILVPYYCLVCLLFLVSNYMCYIYNFINNSMYMYVDGNVCLDAV